MMIILISIGIIYLLNSGTSAFEEAHEDAQQRVQHIQKEIVHAQDIIQQTKFQLDSMEEHVNKLQAEQARITRIYNPSNPEIT